MTSGGRALGIGLLAGAAGITLLMLVWLFVGGASGGGVVLGLLLAFVLAGPLAGGGWYVLSRQPEEERAQIAFSRKRQVLDADRLFRLEVAGALQALSADPAMPTRELQTLAAQLQNPMHGTAQWQDLVQLGDDEMQTLRRYDDLVRERVRRLRDHPDTPQVAVRELQQAVDQREDLLLRGRALPGVSASSILTANEATNSATGVERLGVRDAVTYADSDYLVENVAGYFAEGQRWQVARLVPTRADAAVLWLYVGPGAAEIAAMREVEAPAEGPPQLSGQTLPQVAAGTAAVDVISGSQSAQGVLVSYRLYRDASHLALVEHWPDNVIRAYAGSRIRQADLDVWPAARGTSAPH